jgi:hypothetical protein
VVSGDVSCLLEELSGRGGESPHSEENIARVKKNLFPEIDVGKDGRKKHVIVVVINLHFIT